MVGKKIELKHINKKYENTVIYKDLNVTFKPGEVTAILGPSGGGKTTILNMITGLASYEGTITKCTCSYVFQDPALVPSLTVYENLNLVNKNDKEIIEMLKEFEMTEKKNAYPINLSQGQRHRVAIARALLYDSDVILMDEPFSTLDLKLKTKLMNLFGNLVTKYHKTAIVVTHDVEEAIVLGNRILVVKAGKITLDKTIKSPIPREYGSNDKVRQILINNLIK